MMFLLRGLLCGSALFALAACVLTAPPGSTSNGATNTTNTIEIIEMSSAYKGGVCAPTQKNTSALTLLPSSTALPAPATPIPTTPISDSHQAGVNAAVTPVNSLPSGRAVYEEIEEALTLGALPSNSVKTDTAP